MARYLIAAALVTVLGVIMGYRPPGGAPGVLAGIGLLLAFALSLSWAWTALGLVLRTPQAVMSAGTAAVPADPGQQRVRRPRETMPGWLQAVVKVNPVTHLVTAERGRWRAICSLAILPGRRWLPRPCWPTSPRHWSPVRPVGLTAMGEPPRPTATMYVPVPGPGASTAGDGPRRTVAPRGKAHEPGVG